MKTMTRRKFLILAAVALFAYGAGVVALTIQSGATGDLSARATTDLSPAMGRAAMMIAARMIK